jgi:translation initiation factor IF-3
MALEVDYSKLLNNQILNSNLGLDLLNRIRDELEELAQVDQEPSLEGRQLLMVLSPLKKKN